jgi:hypothetical protein
MNNLRSRARSLYPRLDKSESRFAKQAKQRLDEALTNSIGVVDVGDPRALLLTQACEYTESIG